MSKAKREADIMLEIAYAAFQTHYKVTAQPGWADPETHWNNNPQAQTLWVGLVKGVLVNVGNAQRTNLLPQVLEINVAQPLMQGLGGGPVAQPANAPAALARRLAVSLRDQMRAAEAGHTEAVTGRFSAADPNLSQPPSRPFTPAEDCEERRREANRKATASAPWNEQPGLAIGRGPVADPGQSVLDHSNRDMPPGLAIGRDTECEGEHQVVLDAIETHIRGGDDESDA